MRMLPLSRALDFVASKEPRSLNFRYVFCHSRYSVRRIRMASSLTSDPRGALIVFEGLDRSGKTTLSSRIHTFLEELGFQIESWRFPDRSTSVGQKISSYLDNNSQLDDHAIHHLFSKNRWEKRSLLEAKLKAGTTIIIDRYSYSGVAYSASKGLDIGWCKASEIGLLAPDVVIYLDISAEEAAKRKGYGNERYEELEFQKKVAEKYKIIRDSSWKIVDASLALEDVEGKVKEIVSECVSSCRQGRPLTLLWEQP